MTLSQREAFARTMEHLCNHDSHGYTQGNRWGNGNKETVDLGDGVSVDIMLGDRDCSSAIISALSAVGVDVHDATYTGNMRINILKSGLFEWWDMNHVAQRGDIYLNEACHTAMCTSAYGSAQGDILAEFSISENGTAYGNEGDQTGWESHICAYYDYPWDGILHWKTTAQRSAQHLNTRWHALTARCIAFTTQTTGSTCSLQAMTRHRALVTQAGRMKALAGNMATADAFTGFTTQEMATTFSQLDCLKLLNE